MSTDAAPTTPPEVVTVTDEAERRVLTVGDWRLVVWHDWEDGEPRVRDLDAAVRLGFKQPRMVRLLIERVWPDEARRPRSRAVEERRGNRGGTQTVREYWLTEAELLKLVTRSRTPIAEAITDAMIATYMAVRRKLLVPADASSPALAPPPESLAQAITAARATVTPYGPDALLRWRLILVAALGCDDRTLAARAAAGTPVLEPGTDLSASRAALEAARAWVADVARDLRHLALARPENRRAVGQTFGEALYAAMWPWYGGARKHPTFRYAVVGATTHDPYAVVAMFDARYPDPEPDLEELARRLYDEALLPAALRVVEAVLRTLPTRATDLARRGDPA